MAFNVLWVREKNHLRSVRREVGKPVIKFAVCNLRLLASIGAHAPNLHVTGTHGIEIDVFSVWRIFRAVVESFRRREPLFRAALRRDGVNIKFSASFTDESECFPVG